MISVDSLIKGIRFKQKDNNEILFSDYDIIQSLNEALRYINHSFALKNSDFLEKVQEYRKEELQAEIDEWNEENPDDLKEPFTYADGVDLPEDLLDIVSIERAEDGYPLHPCPANRKVNCREFKVVGGKLYVHEDVNLLYRYTLEAVTVNDSIDLPNFFFDHIVKLTGLILNNADTDTMREAVDSMTNELVPVRRYANTQIPPVWKV